MISPMRLFALLAIFLCLTELTNAKSSPSEHRHSRSIPSNVKSFTNNPTKPSDVGRVRYEANWTSLDTRPLPEWFDDAKFGIFIHWGVYSVPAWQPVGQYAEWYWERLINLDDGGATQAFHNATYGADFKYQDFAPMFKAELFNASEWADLFRRSGARYTVPTSKHHEGFTLWPSQQSWNWNAVDIGPHRDLLAEIMNASRDAGLHAGVYFSIYEWFNPIYMNDPATYVDQILMPQWMDLINNYQPDILWCDGEWSYNSSFWKSEEFLAYVFNDSPVRDTIVVDDRFGSDTSRHHGSFYTPEYDTSVYDHKWEANLGMDIHSYGLNRATPADMYYTADYLIKYLVRSVANGGNMLLDIGPSADGTIPTIMQERLLQMGAWLDVNGEAIYGTRKWRVQQNDGIDNSTIRYTTAKDNGVIFALLLEWPQNNIITLPSPIPLTDANVQMMGVGGTLMWTSNPNNGGINVTLPSFNPGNPAPCDYIWVLRLVNFK